MTPPTSQEAARLLRTLTRALCAVGVLALTFTAVNVTLFATSRGVPVLIAVLLDPMLAIALSAILYADARLAAWGIRPPGWSTALRWWAGCTAAVMNSWSSLWPDGRIGWPHQADPAAVLLHLVPCLLLVGLAETIAAYRKVLAEVHCSVHTAPAEVHPAGDPAPVAPALPDDDPGRELAYSAPDPDTKLPPTRPHAADSGPDTAPIAAHPHRAAERPTDADLFTRARALDAAVRVGTGKPVSIRQLRRQLHLGQARARDLRTRLDALHPDGAPDSAEASDQEQ